MAWSTGRTTTLRTWLDLDLKIRILRKKTGFLFRWHTRQERQGDFPACARLTLICRNIICEIIRFSDAVAFINFAVDYALHLVDAVVVVDVFKLLLQLKLLLLLLLLMFLLLLLLILLILNAFATLRVRL